MEVRFAKGLTIDKQEMALAEAERKRWRDVLHRLVAIIQSLAERNMAFRGSTDTLNVCFPTRHQRSSHFILFNSDIDPIPSEIGQPMSYSS